MIVDEKKNEVGQIFNFVLAKETGREWPEFKEFAQLLQKNNIVWSWGAQNFCRHDSTLLFTVKAHRHKGNIIMYINGIDLFNIYIADANNKILKVFKDVYLEDVIGFIDAEIEFINEYKR